MGLILASLSPYRARQLKDFGLEFTVQAPAVDEEDLKKCLGKLTPRRLSLELAKAKARSIALQKPNAIVISGDQLVNFRGHILGKPGSKDRAIQMLKEMSGKTHELVTSIAVAHGDRILSHTDITKIALRRLTRDEIVRYVHRDMPLDSAGSYRLELSGLSLVHRLNLRDPSALMGIPLLTLMKMLIKLKVPIPFKRSRVDAE